MIPIGDDNTGLRIRPYVTWLLLAANVFVFVFLQGLGSNERFTMAFATVPAEILTGKDVAETIPVRDEYGRPVGEVEIPETPIPVYFTLLTAMFMHGSLMHLLGNMLYLWIFGDNIERAMGSARFLAFYLICGIVAGLAHIAFSSGSMVPSVGASGAISGVLGGYLVMFPRNRVYVLTWGGVMAVPAILMLGLWVVTQFINGVGSIAVTPETGGGGVAYMAHIGGFVAGLVLAPAFARRQAGVTVRRDVDRW
jgi:membrane associated rhomboid family serine protease